MKANFGISSKNTQKRLLIFESELAGIDWDVLATEFRASTLYRFLSGSLGDMLVKAYVMYPGLLAPVVRSASFPLAAWLELRMYGANDDGKTWQQEKEEICGVHAVKRQNYRLKKSS